MIKLGVSITFLETVEISDEEIAEFPYQKVYNTAHIGRRGGIFD